MGGPKQRAHLEKTESALRSNREREIASFSLNGCGQFLKTVQIEAVVPICDKSENIVICGTREEYPNLKSHVSISKTVLSGERRACKYVWSWQPSSLLDSRQPARRRNDNDLLSTHLSGCNLDSKLSELRTVFPVHCHHRGRSK